MTKMTAMTLTISTMTLMTIGFTILIAMLKTMVQLIIDIVRECHWERFEAVRSMAEESVVHSYTYDYMLA